MISYGFSYIGPDLEKRSDLPSSSDPTQLSIEFPFSATSSSKPVSFSRENNHRQNGLTSTKKGSFIEAERLEELLCFRGSSSEVLLKLPEHTAASRLPASFSGYGREGGSGARIGASDVKVIDDIRHAHAEAIELSRSGRAQEALALLDRLRQQSNADFVINDYIAIASRLELDREVRPFYGRIDPVTSPLYVLEAIAASACRQKQCAFSERIYEAVLKRSPQRTSALVGLQLCAAESGRAQVAERELQALAQISPNDVSVQLALARVALIRGDSLGQRRYLSRVLELDPNNSFAFQGLKNKSQDRDMGSVGATRASTKNPTIVNRSLLSKSVEVSRPALAAPVRRAVSESVTSQNKPVSAPRAPEKTDTSRLTESQRARLDQAAGLGREGRFNESFTAFEDLMAETNAPEIMYDYIVVLSWAGKDSEVLEHSSQINLKSTPEYVLEAMGKSARNQRRYPVAKECYRAILQRKPSHAEARRGLELIEKDEAILRRSEAGRIPKAPDFDQAARNPKLPIKTRSDSSALSVRAPEATALKRPEPVKVQKTVQQVPEPIRNSALVDPQQSPSSMEPPKEQSHRLGAGEVARVGNRPETRAIASGAALSKTGQEPMPQRLRMRFLYARELAQQNRLKEAADTMEILLKESRHPDLVNEFIAVASRIGNEKQALALLEKVEADAPPAALEALASSAHKEGNIPLAIQLYTDITNREPGNLTAAIGLQLAHADAGQLNQAALALNQLFDSHPRNIELLEAMARVAAQRGDPYGQRKYNELILEIEPDNGEAHRFLASLASRPAKAKPASEFIEKIAGTSPESSNFEPIPVAKPVAPERLSVCDQIIIAEKEQRFGDALSLMTRCNLAEASAEVLHALGNAALQTGQTGLSKTMYQAALDRNPEDVSVAASLLVHVADQGDGTRALAQLEDLGNRHPGNREILSAQAYVAGVVGDRSKQQHLYRKILEIDPKDPGALAAVASHTGLSKAEGQDRLPGVVANTSPKDFEGDRPVARPQAQAAFQPTRVSRYKNYSAVLAPDEDLPQSSKQRWEPRPDQIINAAKKQKGQKNYGKPGKNEVPPPARPAPLSVSKSAAGQDSASAGSRYERERNRRLGRVVSQQSDIPAPRQPEKIEPVEEKAARPLYRPTSLPKSSFAAEKQTLTPAGPAIETLNQPKALLAPTAAPEEKKQKVPWEQLDLEPVEQSRVESIEPPTDKKAEPVAARQVLQQYQEPLNAAVPMQDNRSWWQKFRDKWTNRKARSARGRVAVLEKEVKREQARRDAEARGQKGTASDSFDQRKQDLYQRRNLRNREPADPLGSNTPLSEKKSLPERQSPRQEYRSFQAVDSNRAQLGVLSARELNAGFSDRIKRDKSKAIIMARENRFVPAIALMQKLMRETDEADGVLFDYLVVLSWAGKHDEVMKYVDRVPVNRLPDYIASAIARSAREKQNYALSGELYGAVLKRNPADIGIRTAYWTVRAEAGYTREAHEELARLNQEEPDELEVLFSLAKVAGLEGDDSAERLYYRQILRKDSTNERARRGLKLATLMDSGEVSLYDQDALDPATINSEAIRQRHQEAVQLSREGRMDEALSLMEILLLQTDYATPLLYDYLLMLSWAGESSDMLGFAPRVNLEEAPEYVITALAKAARNSGKLDKARQFYQAILDRDPHKIDALVGQALCLAESRKTAESLSDLQQLLFLYPGSPDLVQVWQGLGYVARLDAKPSLSRYYYRQALKLDPHLKEAQEALAVGRPDPEKTLEEATGLSPFDSEAIRDEAEFSIQVARNGDPQQALQSLACLMDRVGPVGLLFNDYLQYLSWAGEHIDAIAWNEILDPQVLPPSVLLTMGHSARNLADPGMALAFYRLALEGEPEFVEARIGEALALAEAGQVELGLFSLETLSAKFPRRLDVLAAIAYASRFSPRPADQNYYVDRFLNGSGDEQAMMALPRSIGLQPERVISNARLLRQEPENRMVVIDWEEQQTAVLAARQGQLTAAMETLSCLMDEPGAPESLLLDYAVILSWADRHQEVLALLDVLDPATAPSFTLGAIARSARHSGNFPLAGQLYQIIYDRNPDDLDSQIGILVCQAAALEDREAYNSLLALLQHHPHHRPLLEALLPLTVKMDDVFNEIVCYQRFLEINPEDAAASRGMILAVSRMGAPDLALDILEKEQVPVSPVMKEQVLGDRAAKRVGWGNISQEERNTLRERHGETDLALQMLETNLSANDPYGMERLGEWLRTQWDRLVALKQRNRIKEVVETYEQLAPYHDRVPAFAKAAVAGAYRSMGKPDVARVLYQEVLKAAPSFFDAKIGLYFAYLEDEKLDKAMDHIDMVAASEPAIFQMRGSRVRGRNPAKLTADMMNYTAIAYEDRLAEAQDGFEELYFKAPHNEGLRQSLATIYRWRGWPRMALHNYEVLAGQNPENRGARVGQIYSLMSLQRFDEAHEMALDYYNQFPDEEDAQKLMRDWSVSQGYEIYTTASSFRGPGQQTADDELNIESYVYGPSFRYWWKPFAHYRYQTAEYPQGSYDYRRIGGGLMFRRHDFSGTLEAHANQETYEDPGFIASGNYSFNDFWSVGAELNSKSFNVSPRARLAGIDGEEYNGRITFRPSDKHRFNAGVQILDLSDGNQRQALTLNSFHTLYMGPRWRHFGGASLYGSQGDTSGDRPYYNPGHDFSSGLTLDTYFLTWRKYGFKLVQRMVLDYGLYQQQNYSGDWTGALRYEHEWDLIKDLGLLYGVTRARRVYDGNPEYSTNYYMTLKWKF